MFQLIILTINVFINYTNYDEGSVRFIATVLKYYFSLQDSCVFHKNMFVNSMPHDVIIVILLFQ